MFYITVGNSECIIIKMQATKPKANSEPKVCYIALILVSVSCRKVSKDFHSHSLHDYKQANIQILK